MPDCFREMIIELFSLVPVICLSLLGGLVSYLNRPREGFSFWSLLIEFVTAGFVGLVIHYLMISTSLPPGLQAAAVSVSGYASRDVLFLVKKRFLNNLSKGGFWS